MAISPLDLLDLRPARTWRQALAAGLPALGATYAAELQQHQVPVTTLDGKQMTLSPGEHSELIKAIVEDFAPRFAPGSALVYAGVTGAKWGYFDSELSRSLGVTVDSHMIHFNGTRFLGPHAEVQANARLASSQHGRGRCLPRWL